MKRGLEWYKREPAAFLDACRAAQMTAVQVAVYAVVIDLLYLTGGETPNDPRYIAAHLSDVGPAKVRATIEQLVAMGKLTVNDGMLHQKRAENEAQTRRNLSVIKSDAGRFGGIRSGISRRKANEINETAEADASSKTEAEERRGEKEEEEECARESDAPDLYTRVLVAVGLNPSDILPTYWLPPGAIVHVESWRNIGPAGLTDDDIEAVARGSRNGRAPPNGPLALDRAMARFAGQKAAPPLQPIAPEGGTTHGRRASPADPDRTQRVIDGAVARFRAGRT